LNEILDYAARDLRNNRDHRAIDWSFEAERSFLPFDADRIRTSTGRCDHEPESRRGGQCHEAESVSHFALLRCRFVSYQPIQNVGRAADQIGSNHPAWPKRESCMVTVLGGAGFVLISG
jgi:hypothetical protein